MKYLLLNKDWVIRGTKEIPRLYNWKNGKVIKLNNDILKYIMECTGKHTVSNIAEKYNISVETVSNFFNQFICINVVDEISKPVYKEIDYGLGKKEPWLREVHLDVTNNCNLKCKHCFWGTNIKEDKNIEKEKWVNLILSLKNIGVGKVVISGGEAFTRKDLIDLIKACTDSSIYLGAIFTNGTIDNYNTDIIIDYLIQNKMHTSFYISLDGYVSEQHDFIRGEGKFALTTSFISKLIERRTRDHGVYRIMINSLIHQKNYNKLIEWYDYLEKLGVDSWRFTTGRITGSLENNTKEVSVELKDYFPHYVELTEYVISKYKQNHKMAVNIENFFNTRYMDKGKIELFNEEYPICDYKLNACSIDPKGNVQFCTGWQNVKYGNVFEVPLDSIWYSEKLQSIKNFKIKNIEECKNCEYLKYCGGGCRLECKQLIDKDEKVCDSFKLFHEQIVPILKKENIEFVG